MKIRVYYEDTDAGGIVYHTNYIKYCERARSELFFQRGEMPFSNDRSGFVVRHIEADFRGMARLGDMLEVQTQILDKKRTSIGLLQSVKLQGTVIFSMKIYLVYVEEGRPKKIPPSLLSILEERSEA